MVRLVFIILFLVRASFAVAETKTAIKPSELHQKILDDIKKNYPDYAIVDAFKVNNRGIVTFEAIIQKNKDRLHLFYSQDGVFLRKELPRQNRPIVRKPPGSKVQAKGY